MLVFSEHCPDTVFESEIQNLEIGDHVVLAACTIVQVLTDLGRKVSDAICQIASQEWQQTLVSERSHGAIDHTVVGLGDDTLFQHFTLTLQQ